MVKWSYAKWFWMSALFLFWGCQSGETYYSAWTDRGANKAQNRYSNLTQIDTSNVSGLEVAWTYHTGDAKEGSQIQTNPIIIGDLLYGVSPQMKVFALDAATGEEKWLFDPFGESGEQPSFNINRGVSYWEGEDEARLLFSAGSFLYGLDAETGKPMESFGQNGKVSLKVGFGERYKDYYAVATSPGVVYEDLIIMGSRVSEGADAAPGDIQAFDVRSGELKWTFHTIPRPGEYGHDTWDDPDGWEKTGGANSWAGMAVDEERGIIFVPTGSASPDFYGGDRRGENLFANSLLALDATTGERIWHYQTIHHDLWDRDLPSPPTLVTVEHEGKRIDAVAQTSKMGYVFLFDRESGTPLFDIEERPVPAESPLAGEQVWPTQPAPVRPEPLMRQHMAADDINPFVPEAEQEVIREKLTGYQSESAFHPPSLIGNVQFPGFDGGAEWGGSAYDPETNLLYVNTNEVPWILKMIDKRPDDGPALSPSKAIGRATYRSQCVACHGMDLQGSGRSPALTEVDQRRSPGEILDLIGSGSGMMPAFNHISLAKKKALVNYLLDDTVFEVDASELSDKQEASGNDDSSERYILNGYTKFQTEEGYPANSPPWGRLNAINLNTGDIAWQIPLGEYPELSARGISPTGTENYGGPAVTKGGVVFIAATLDKKIRAFHKGTGELLWEAELPYAGFATPSIYEAGGKQYIVIACGGGKLGTDSGDAYIAFALPSEIDASDN